MKKIKIPGATPSLSDSGNEGILVLRLRHSFI
jgi:hypothetical protein